MTYTVSGKDQQQVAKIFGGGTRFVIRLTSLYKDGTNDMSTSSLIVDEYQFDYVRIGDTVNIGIDLAIPPAVPAILEAVNE